jgi:hypothetical protein
MMEYYTLGKLNKSLFLLIEFISFYVVVKFFSTLQSFIGTYITGFWTEPVSIAIAFLLVIVLMPWLLCTVYFKHIRGIK